MENRLNILLNGPSLTSYFESHRQPLLGDVLVTNNFSNSQLFDQLDITHYLFQDEYYWIENPLDHFLKIRDRTFQQISRSGHDLALILPSHISENGRQFILNKLNTNHSKLVSYRHKLGSFPTYRTLKHIPPLTNFLIKHEIITPPPLNVLVGALLFGIQSRYQEIRIIGCDMGYFRHFEIDPNNGKLCVTEHYHYGDVKSYLKVNKEHGAASMSVYDALKRELHVHSALNYLNNYAKSHKIDILNENPESFIQCFQKVYQ